MPEDADLEALRARRLRELETSLAAKQAAASAVVTDLGGGEFDAFLAAHEFVLVDFWAIWCGPCRTVAPIVRELAGDFAGRLSVGKVDTDRWPEIAGRYDITAIPTLILFKGGQPVEILVGAQPKARLTAAVQRWV